MRFYKDRDGVYLHADDLIAMLAEFGDKEPLPTARAEKIIYDTRQNLLSTVRWMISRLRDGS